MLQHCQRSSCSNRKFERLCCLAMFQQTPHILVYKHRYVQVSILCVATKFSTFVKVTFVRWRSEGVCFMPFVTVAKAITLNLTACCCCVFSFIFLNLYSVLVFVILLHVFVIFVIVFVFCVLLVFSHFCICCCCLHNCCNLLLRYFKLL